MDDLPEICALRWRGPRADVPEASALHVCCAPRDHKCAHVCMCQATKEESDGS